MAEEINLYAVLIGLAAPLLFGVLRQTAVSSYSRKVRAAALAKKAMNEDAQLKSQAELEDLRVRSIKPPVPLFARDGADNILLPFLTFVWIAVCVAGQLLVLGRYAP
jgi:hypothetical protein